MFNGNLTYSFAVTSLAVSRPHGPEFVRGPARPRNGKRPTESRRDIIMTDADYMKLAITKTREGIAAGQSPFGSAIVQGDKVVAVTHNTVWRDGDPTAHAEVNCIRAAAQ